MNNKVNHPRLKTLTNFKKHITNKLNLLLFFLFLIFTTTTFSQTVDTFSTAGTGTWVCPAGVTSVKIEAWGAGAGGGFARATNNAAAGGGGGGEYTYSNTISVVPGTTYYYRVGTGGSGGLQTGTAATAGGSSCFSTATNCGGTILTSANGGNIGTSVATNTSGTGGTGGTGGVFSNGGAFRGGNGANGLNGNGASFGGGGGGGGASTLGNGGDTTNRNGGIGTGVGGGNGGNGGSNLDGTSGNNIGGGGAGGHRNNNSNNGGNGGNGQIRITYTIPGSYCAATNTASTSYYITNVTSTGGVANFNNSSAAFAAYSNFSAQFVSQFPGANFSLSATHPTSTYGYNVWVDWNNDTDFNDAGENVLSTGYLSTPASLGSVTIPLGQAAGDYRMRIRNAYLSNPAPACGAFDYGEAEDYTVRVIASPACSGAPTAGTTTVSPATGSPGSSYTVSASGFTNATGLTFQWQYSTTGSGGPWTNQGSATGTYSNYTATAPALGITTHWRLVVTCTASAQSANSVTAAFTSVSTQNIPTTGNNTVTCGTNIVLFDNGGNAGDYANSSNGYTVLEAGLGATINISGNYVTESSDYIKIYNGTGTGGTLLGTYSGTGSINYTGTAGQTLTVQFTSDSSIVYSGFSLSVNYSGTCFPVCAGTPTGGTAVATPGSASPGSTYTVSASGYTGATGLTFQWQYSTTGSGGPWINQGASSATYSNVTATAPALGTTVLWHLIVTCTSSGQSGTSTNGTFNSVSTQNIPTTGNTTVTCGTNIVLYDNGGSTGDYANSSTGYTVLEAGLASTITISGNYITENSLDYIRIYN
ncbi:GEVED domain-containing protein [Flavobacterium facile]|uniref:GEVED domain-containing protein n=1 Tax=Flavobacterium facile TaxID=2893174 RepID=UPI002E7724FD|nr:GEVED domain-containing protein [Flavobacterium sp. T-12]